MKQMMAMQAKQTELIAHLAANDANSREEGNFKFDLQQVVKLAHDGANYKEWSVGVERMLRAHKSKLWGILDETETLASNADDTTKALFQKRQYQLLTVLLSAMGEEKKAQYQLYQNPVELWATLKMYSATHTVESSVALLARLQGHVFDPAVSTVEAF